MGNEGSSLRPHAGLTKAELEQLQKTFPQKTGTNLWRPWTDVFQPNQTSNIAASLKCPKTGVITFQNYQQLYGDLTKGGIEAKISFLLMLLGHSSNCNISSETLKASLEALLGAFGKCSKSSFKRSNNDDVVSKMADSLLHDLAFFKEKRKNTYNKEATVVNITPEEIEDHILKTPLIETLLSVVVGHCFQTKPMRSTGLIPSIPDDSLTSLSLLQAVFLNSHLPHEQRQVWRPLFNTDTHGESFSKFAGAITKQGPTLIIVWDETGNIFGGYATDSWKMGPKFCGKSESFLFHLHPKMNVYDSTPFNTNYQYFNLKQKTMPNGLGMGGQLEYFGFWIDQEFGIVQTSPSCSTFHSPQLGKTDGRIKRLEVFGVGDLNDDDLDAGPSVLDMDPEAQAVLEMMGKTFHSKVIREVDEDQEKKKQLEDQFNDSV